MDPGVSKNVFDYFFLPLRISLKQSVWMYDAQSVAGFSFPMTLMLCATFNILGSGQKQSGRGWSPQTILTEVVVQNLEDLLIPFAPSQIDYFPSCVYFFF